MAERKIHSLPDVSPSLAHIVQTSSRRNFYQNQENTSVTISSHCFHVYCRTIPCEHIVKYLQTKFMIKKFSSLSREKEKKREKKQIVDSLWNMWMSHLARSANGPHIVTVWRLVSMSNLRNASIPTSKIVRLRKRSCERKRKEKENILWKRVKILYFSKIERHVVTIESNWISSSVIVANPFAENVISGQGETTSVLG